jgi:hypothetical protein
MKEASWLEDRWRLAIRVSATQFFDDERRDAKSVACGIEQRNGPATCASSLDIGSVWLLASRCAFISHILKVDSSFLTTYINDIYDRRGAPGNPAMQA